MQYICPMYIPICCVRYWVYILIMETVLTVYGDITFDLYLISTHKVKCKHALRKIFLF